MPESNDENDNADPTTQTHLAKHHSFQFQRSRCLFDDAINENQWKMFECNIQQVMESGNRRYNVKITFYDIASQYQANKYIIDFYKLVIKEKISKITKVQQTYIDCEYVNMKIMVDHLDLLKVLPTAQIKIRSRFG